MNVQLGTVSIIRTCYRKQRLGHLPKKDSEYHKTLTQQGCAGQKLWSMSSQFE